MKKLLSATVLWFPLATMVACGGVGFEGGERPAPLKLLHLFPRDGEKGVATTVTVLAHFSDDVFAENQCLSSEVIDEQTFRLAPCNTPGTPVSALVGCFQFLSEDGQTVIGEDRKVATLSPLQPLAGATDYCLTLEASIHGLKTASMGVDIEAVFTTAP